jgi:regulator of protease activity HflC (stomatin/prohibitin superfamily)
MLNKFTKGAIAFGVVILVVIIGYFMSTETIKPGYAGIVYSAKGGVKEGVLTQGIKTVLPWEKITLYSIATEQGYMSKDSREGSEGDDSFFVPTKSGKTVSVDLEYSYHFDAEKLPLVFSKFRSQSGKAIEDVFMRGKLKSWAAEVTSKFEILDIYGDKREALNAAALKHLQTKFGEFGIVIETVNFSRIGLDPETEKAVQARITAQQQLETIKTQKLLATENASKANIEANGVAAAALITANGEAAVKKAKAAGEASANNLLQASMTDKLVEYKKLEVQQAQAEAMGKWTVSTYIAGGGQTPLLNLPASK